jgi:hypothetical protein
MSRARVDPPEELTLETLHELAPHSGIEAQDWPGPPVPGVAHRDHGVEPEAASLLIARS